MSDKTYRVVGDLSIWASESGEDYPATLYLQRSGSANLFPLLIHEAASLIVILENARRELLLKEVEKRK